MKIYQKYQSFGTGLVNNPVVISTIMESLCQNNVEINMISTIEIKISILVEKDKADLAINAIHQKLFK